jgi:hypothetical protein
MTRVGMVDLSTSHPGIFTPLLADLGMPVAAVFGAGAPEFTRARPEVVVAAGLVELAELCDVVMLLGADWDERMDQVAVLAPRVPVFVDKPMAGTAGELRALANLADGPARIDGGSALRVAPEAVAVRDPVSVDVTCVGHPFYYGVHAVALATAVLGPGLVAARGLGGDPELSLHGVVEHVSGAEIRVAVSTAGVAGGFRATVDTGVGADTQIEPAADAFYPALLRDTMTRLTTATMDRRPGRELVECELALLAMAWSLSAGGDRVALDAAPADFRPWRGRASRR